MAVLEAFVQYRQPLKFDDVVNVNVAMGTITRATFQMTYLLTVDGRDPRHRRHRPRRPHPRGQRHQAPRLVPRFHPTGASHLAFTHALAEGLLPTARRRRP